MLSFYYDMDFQRAGFSSGLPHAHTYMPKNQTWHAFVFNLKKSLNHGYFSWFGHHLAQVLISGLL